VFDEDSNFLRYSPRYMFGANSPLYIKIKAENDFLENKYVDFKTFSGSKAIGVNAIKKSSDKNVFDYYCSSEALYFSSYKPIPLEKQISEKSLFVKDDEIEFVSVYINEQLAERKYIDVSEIGVWFCSYVNYPYGKYLPYSKDEATIIHNSFSDNDIFKWNKSFNIGNYFVKPIYFTKSTFSQNAYTIPEIDNVDLAFYSGHGNFYDPKMEQHDVNEPIDVYLAPQKMGESVQNKYLYDYISRDEVIAGKRDCSWFIADCCFFLLGFEKINGSDGSFKLKIEPINKPGYGEFKTKENVIKNLIPIMYRHGLKLLIGFKTESYYQISAPGGWRYFKSYLEDNFKKYLFAGKSIKNAWFHTIEDYVESTNSYSAPCIISRILYHHEAQNDKIINTFNANNFPIENSFVPKNDKNFENYTLIECGNSELFENEEN
jgi:hypothetical protein